MMNLLIFVALAAVAWLGLRWVDREIEKHLDTGDDRRVD